MLQPNMVSMNDMEGTTVPTGLPPLIDAHVHIFPDAIFSAVRKWFAEHAYPIRYQMSSAEVFDFLFSRGIEHIIALQYAHKPGIARELNNYMVELCRQYRGRVTGMATVFPGEENGEAIVQEAFDRGLGGLKLHAHVQCFDMNSDEIQALYQCCLNNRKPVVMHVGREPASSAYNCDSYELCGAEKLEMLLYDYPELKICVPHLGFDEVTSYRRLIESYDNIGSLSPTF